MQISTLFGYVFVELWVVIALGSPLGTFDRHGGVIGLGGNPSNVLGRSVWEIRNRIRNMIYRVSSI